MGAVRERFRRVSHFFADEIWHDPEDAGSIHNLLYQTVRVILLTVSGMKNQMIMMRASALSYYTLLAVIPIFAIAFSMMKGLGVHSRLEHVLINYLTAEQEAVTNRIIEYVSRTDFKAMGAFGTAILIYAVVMMLSYVEITFNELWGVRRNRVLLRKVSHYISVLILGPLLIVISTALITFLSSNTVVQALSRYALFERFFILFHTIIPYAGLWIAFTAMYMLMPNTRVRFTPALIAGIVCGSMWEAAFMGYTRFNIGLARYNTIYGTFAALPIFIIWLYISWIIILIGARLSYAIQNVRLFQLEFKAPEVGYAEREEMAINIMLKISERFYKGLPQLNGETLSKTLSIPLRMIGEITKILCDHSLLQEVYGNEPLYQPARNPDMITVYDVCAAMRNAGRSHWQVSEKEKNKILQQLMKTKKAAEAEQLGRVTILDLLRRNELIAAI